MGKGAALDGDKGHEGAGARGDNNQWPLEKAGEGKAINDDAYSGAAGQLEKLFEGHVADQAEFVRGNVLGNRMLVHLLQSSNKVLSTKF